MQLLSPWRGGPDRLSQLLQRGARSPTHAARYSSTVLILTRPLDLVLAVVLDREAMRMLLADEQTVRDYSRLFDRSSRIVVSPSDELHAAESISVSVSPEAMTPAFPARKE